MATALPLLKAMTRSDPLGFAQGVGNKPALAGLLCKKRDRSITTSHPLEGIAANPQMSSNMLQTIPFFTNSG